MKKIYVLLLFFCLALSAGNITVILPVKSTVTENTAAKELQTLLKKTSKVTIVKEGAKFSGKVIYVGSTAAAKKYGAVKKFDGDEWLIRAIDGNRIILNGGRRGVIYAAYELLERLGNLMFLDQYTTHGPEKEPEWSKNYAVSGKMPFSWRTLYSYFPPDLQGRHLWNMRSRQNFFINEKFSPLMKAHGLTPFFGKPRASHTFYSYTKEWKNAPDEYFSLSARTGKRERAVSPYGPGQVCFTHPEVRKLFAQQLEKFIQMDMADYKDVPPPVCYAIAHNDNNNPCVCENCKAAVKKLGNYTGLVIDFVNHIGRSVAKKYPHVILKMSAYFFAQPPPVPGTKIEKNVVPSIAQMGMEWEDFSSFTRTKRESLLPLNHPVNARAFKEFKQWASFGKISTWDYWMTWRERGLLTDNCEAVRENLKIYKDTADIICGEIEYPLQTSFHPLRMYLIHRLWSDPARDADAEIERFMNVYYGKAVKEMKAVRALILAENKTLNGKMTVPVNVRKGLNVRYFTEAEKLFNAALAKAKGDKALTQRIKRERFNFDRVRTMLPQIPANLAPGDQVVRKRMLAVFNELANLYLSGEGRKRETAEIERAASGPVFTTEPVKEFPGRKVVAHFRGNSFSPQYKAISAADADSATGTAIYHPVNGLKTEGVRFGYLNSIAKKSVIRTIGHKQFKFDGKYHWYRIGEVTLAPSCYVFAHKTWQLQRPLNEVYGMTADNRVDIYVKLKTEMDKKNPQKVDKLWLDGVLLLEPQVPGKVETEKTTAQKSQTLVKKTSNVPLAKEGAKD